MPWVRLSSERLVVVGQMKYCPGGVTTPKSLHVIKQEICSCSVYLTIGVLTLQPKLILPLLWYVNYLELSFPILQIAGVVPSRLSFDYTGHYDHEVILTIAAIFESAGELSRGAILSVNHILESDLPS